MRISDTIHVDDLNSENTRIDKYIADFYNGLTRSQLKARNTDVFINNKPVKLSRIVNNGDLIKIEYDSVPESDMKAENIELDIIYEDENIAVINKTQGMVVHPAPGNPNGTLANALLYHFENYIKVTEEDEIRPGIVHRLDKDTSGIIITAKNIKTHEFLSEQFRLKKAKKKYLAAVKGKMHTTSGTIETNLTRDTKNRKRFAVSTSSDKGKHALTHYRVLKEYRDASLVALELETGRTHQLRVHMQHIGCPIIGDPVYSRKITRYNDFTLMLHAYTLEIEIPLYGLKKFFAPLPVRFKNFILMNS